MTYGRDMGDVVGMFRTRMTINGDDYELSAREDVTQLKRRIEAAAEPPGHFAEFRVVGDGEVSVLITPLTRVALFTTRVTRDDASQTESLSPYPGEFDY